MSFITDDEKTDLAAVFDILHDTFKRNDIYAHKDGELVVLSEDPNYSSIYSSPRPDGTNQQVTLQKQSFYARILFDEKQHLRVVDLGGESSLKLKLQDGELRIKVDSEGKAFLRDAKKVEINNSLYEFVTTGRPHGLFVDNFYTYYLRKVQ